MDPFAVRFLSCGVLAAALAAGSGCAGDGAPRVPPRAEILPPREAAPMRTVGGDEALARARDRVSAADFAGAVAALRPLAVEERSAAARQLLVESAAREPGAGARLALALPRGDLQAEALALVLRAWLARESDAALAWALDEEDSSARVVLMDTLATEFVAHDPRAALEWLRALPERPRRMELLRLTAARWARNDPDAALGWAGTLPDETRRGAMTSIVFELAQTRPARAADLIGGLPEGRERALVLSAIARTWVAVDPKAAEAWLRGLPPGATRDAALAGMSSATGTIGTRGGPTPVPTRRNRAVAMANARAGATLEPMSLPAGPAREEALQRELNAQLASSPARAAAWLGSLPTGDLSDELLRKLAREWFRQDPAAARMWFEQHVASPLRRDQILFEARP